MLFNAKIIDLFLDGFKKSSIIVDDAWQISHLKLAAESEFSDLSVLYISEGDNGTVNCRNGNNRIVVLESNICDVFNAISTKMNYYNQWEISALNSVQQSASSLDSVALIAKLFPDFVVKVVTPLGKFVHSSVENSDAYIDSSFISIIRSIPACYRIALGAKGLVVFREQEHYGKNIMLGNIVFSDNSYIMFSVIEREKPISDVEKHLAELAQSIFEKLVFSMEFKNLIEPYESTLASLLKGDAVGESMLKNLETVWGYSIEDGAHLAIILNNGNKKFGTRAMVSSINEKLPKTFAFTYEREVICLLPSRDFQAKQGILEQLAVSAKSKIIFSTNIFDWGSLAPMYRNMEAVFAMFDERQSPESVIYCSDYIWDYCLWTLKTQGSSILIHPDVLALMALDADGRFLDTAYSYFSNNCKMSSTANDLHVHLSTLKYRMEKIYSTISLDPDNYSHRMSFLLSCDLLRLCKN